MEKINLYLEKFKSLPFKNIIVRDVVVEVFKDLFAVELGKNDITIKNNEIVIFTHPVLKSEMFIKQAIIKKEIERRLGEKVKTVR
ncbi:MAG: hypothetical protein COV70_04200 [Parcubacteria group bacterium CG11_big_fil_rev_8_21_14_0_20_39_22]|nr:MAG: hypothetical protein COV70_04200 [Parcubacteria group bacterium CG11_big_fil_rev_8_21_14_0_20_39_22]